MGENRDRSLGDSDLVAIRHKAPRLPPMCLPSPEPDSVQIAGIRSEPEEPAHISIFLADLNGARATGGIRILAKE
jgi:hypothetical protein